MRLPATEAYERRQRREQARARAREMKPMTQAQLTRVATLLSLVARNEAEAGDK